MANPVIQNHLSYIESPETKAAYQHFLTFFSERKEVHSSTPKGVEKGHKKSVIIQLHGKSYFSFIANKNDLLFYFRLLDTNPYRSKLPLLKERGFTINDNPNSASEATVRIRNQEEAQNLIEIVFG